MSVVMSVKKFVFKKIHTEYLIIFNEIYLSASVIRLI